jgi:hypothetical protein
MREDRRSEPGLANGRVEAGRMQESIQALRPQSNPMLFVHSCCTNSDLRRTPVDLPESVCVRESPRVPSTSLRLLGLCHHRLFSRFIRSMSVAAIDELMLFRGFVAVSQESRNSFQPRQSTRLFTKSRHGKPADIVVAWWSQRVKARPPWRMRLCFGRKSWRKIDTH